MTNGTRLCASLAVWCGVAASTTLLAQPPIDRQALVARHRVVMRSADPLSPLSVGNGSLAFTADITGLQSYPEAYETGTPLGTLSTWGWHSFANPEGYRLDDALVRHPARGRDVPYADVAGTDERAVRAAGWLRANPHRLDLGRIGLILTRVDGTAAPLDALERTEQSLDLWSGTLTSRFAVEGVDVRVETVVHPDLDLVAVRVVSPLVRAGRVRLQVSFPYASGTWDKGRDWTRPESHVTSASIGPDRASLARTLDDTRYHVTMRWTSPGTLASTAPHAYVLTGTTDSLSSIVLFTPVPVPTRDRPLPDVATSLEAAARHWAGFWSAGGAIDLSGSADPRWRELERRVVLSQFHTALHAAGPMPPQETGLVTNSWFGKAHLEMHWWHAAHFATWGRSPVLARALDWYREILPRARVTARTQGYEGVRWPKMVGPDGRESPSNVGTYLIWQQPHPIYLAELLWRDASGRSARSENPPRAAGAIRRVSNAPYRPRTSREVLDRYAPLVFESAAFMASFVAEGPDGQLHLPPPLIPAQETYGRMKAAVQDPTFELAYWRWALGIAQQWRARLGLPPEPTWDRVRERLVRPMVRDGRYAAIAVEPFTTPTDHPSMLMAYGFLPATDGIDSATMAKTIDWVRAHWDWDSTWGWDYPVLAMTAARLGRPAEAVDALLLDTPKNRWMANGHTPQRPNLPVYLPSNGGLLAAIAMMAAGWDGAPARHAPGFPDDGSWVVRVEGISRVP